MEIKMEDESESESYLVIVTKKDRLKVFCKIYWRTLVIIIAALALLPVAFLGNDDAYPCFYVLLLTTTYYFLDVLPPGVIAIIPVAISCFMSYASVNLIEEVAIRSAVFNVLGVMMTMAAIEYSRIHRRIALKILLVFGCSHYRLSFMLFFTCMFLSMWMTNILACGVLIPILKAILLELERLGILELYLNIEGRKIRQKFVRHEQSVPIPTVFTIFYYLGLAYSSSIGGSATLIGSRTNEVLKYYSETIFPFAPKLDFPHVMLISLPGVLLIETLVYLWLNFYFMGMFRAQSEIALAIGISEEEAQYIHTLLSTQYNKLGRITFHEFIVSIVICLMVLLEIYRHRTDGHTSLFSSSTACSLLFFIIPTKLDFIKFFRKRDFAADEPFPMAPSKACLNWTLMCSNIHWSVLFTTAGCCVMFEALKNTHFVDELESFLLLVKTWPAPAQALFVIIFSKVLTELATNSCVLYCILPSVAKLAVESKVNPHYLMVATSIACNMPFHLVTGTPANAMIVEYVHIPPWKMMHAGLGPSLIAIVAVWFTVTLWSKAIWPDINVFPAWAEDNTLTYDYVPESAKTTEALTNITQGV